MLAALGAQWIISDFGSMTSIDAWTAGVTATPPLSLDGLEDHAALIYCSGVIALHQVQRGEGLPDPATCLEHYCARLYAAGWSAGAIVGEVGIWVNVSGQTAKESAAVAPLEVVIKRRKR